MGIEIYLRDECGIFIGVQAHRLYLVLEVPRGEVMGLLLAVK